jgi:hypothetical protein
LRVPYRDKLDDKGRGRGRAKDVVQEEDALLVREAGDSVYGEEEVSLLYSKGGEDVLGVGVLDSQERLWKRRDGGKEGGKGGVVRRRKVVEGDARVLRGRNESGDCLPGKEGGTKGDVCEGRMRRERRRGRNGAEKLVAVSSDWSVANWTSESGGKGCGKALAAEEVGAREDGLEADARVGRLATSRKGARGGRGEEGVSVVSPLPFEERREKHYQLFVSGVLFL